MALPLTFNDIPQAISDLRDEFISFRNLFLSGELKGLPSNEADRWFDIDELCEYLPDKPAKPTIYAKVHTGKVPYHKRRGEKKLRFLKSEIDEWFKIRAAENCCGTC
jgi:excisionase family DNA binding protein